MPQNPKPTPPVRGLQAADPESIINQRTAINGMMSTAIPHPTEPWAFAEQFGDPLTYNRMGPGHISEIRGFPPTADIGTIASKVGVTPGAVAGLIHGVRGDIELPAEQWSVDELLRRAAALK